MVWLSEIWKDFQALRSDEDGTAGLQFVIASPFLLGTLVFTAEHGQAGLVLDHAVQDSARYVADDGSKLINQDAARYSGISANASAEDLSGS